MKHKRKNLVLGITGGIAAFKAVQLIRVFRHAGYKVIPILTRSAKQLVDSQDIAKAAGTKVFSELFPRDFSYKSILKVRKVDHIEVADDADCVVIAPATANIIGKIALGLADDFLTTMLLATRAPILVCPSMNTNMWNNPVVQENIEILKRRGMRILEPVSGMLACGYEGKGRLPSIDTIVDEVRMIAMQKQELQGQTVLVTSGGTVEPIDDIRYITNKSSGKMGAAMADACVQRGASVILLKAKNSVVPRFPMTIYEFETADELESLLHKEAEGCDICFHVAAVSDYSVSFESGKRRSDQAQLLRLSPRKKAYVAIKKGNPRLKLYLFKAEWKKSSQVRVEKARNTMMKADAEGIIINDVGEKGRGFAVDTNEVTVLLRNGDVYDIPLCSKREVAEKIIDLTLGKTNE